MAHCTMPLTGVTVIRVMAASSLMLEMRVLKLSNHHFLLQKDTEMDDKDQYV